MWMKVVNIYKKFYVGFHFSLIPYHYNILLNLHDYPIYFFVCASNSFLTVSLYDLFLKILAKKREIQILSLI
jgi:hypothetical protein